MQLNLLWTGRAHHSLENCLVTLTETGTEVNSVIIGGYQDKIYRVAYRIKTNQNWETVFFEVLSQHSDKTERICFESDGKGHWMADGQPAEQFRGCMEVDISLTPFTNSLPINRLRLAPQEVQQVQVIYLDILEGQIKPARQQYTRLSEYAYHYGNVPNNFEADITVDEFGMVTDYPALFVRTARLESNYG